MQALSFDSLRRELAAAGAAPALIERMIQELKEHCEDAESAAIEQGAGPVEARALALESLGPASAIVAETSARRDLLDWRHRWPQSARCVDTLGLCLTLPAAPFVYVASHRAGLARWGLSSSLAVCVTASILLTLQWLMPNW